MRFLIVYPGFLTFFVAGFAHFLRREKSSLLSREDEDEDEDGLDIHGRDGLGNVSTGINLYVYSSQLNSTPHSNPPPPDTGPLFDPSSAAHFAYNSLVIPAQTSLSLSAIHPTAQFSMATTIPGLVLPTTLLESSARASQSTSARESGATSPSSTVAETATSSSSEAEASAPPQQSTGAAVRHGWVVGVVAGGLLAGLVLA